MTSIKLTVAGAEVWASVTGILTSGMVGIPVTIQYDASWNGLRKNLVCRCSPWNSDRGDYRTILNVGEAATVAHEVMQPDMILYLGVEGYSSDGKLVMPTRWAECGKIQRGANSGADISADPTLPVWGQLQTEIEELKETPFTEEQLADIQAGVQTAVDAAASAERSKKSATAASTLAVSSADKAEGFADSARISMESAKTSASSAAYLANETLRLQRAAEAAAERAEAAADSGQNVTIEPADDDIPKVFITGVKPTTKDNVLAELVYISKGRIIKAYIKIKCQGTSSMAYSKKNFTVTLYQDEARTIPLYLEFKDWGTKVNKFVLKANFIDHSHARNIVSARLWNEVVASRPDYDTLPEELRNSPRNGAVDGFPIKVYYNGTYEGIYTWNIGKDDWMWGMDKDNPNHILLCAEGNTDGVYAETASNFRALWNGVDGQKPGWSVEVGTNSAALKTSLNNLIQFVMDNDGEAFRNGIGQYLDIQSAIDYYIFQYDICGLDGLAHNMLLATYDGTVWHCGAYDMDATFGLWWDGTKFVPAQYRCPEDYQEQFSLLWERIEANYRTELKARQAALRKAVLSYSNMVTHFERFMDTIGLDLYAEDLTIYNAIPSGATNNIKQIRSFIRDRQVYVDAEFTAMSDPVPCTGITLDKSVLSFTAEGTQTLTATVTPDGCTDVVTWQSDNTGVAAVSGGVVTAIGNGSATITARCGNYSATCGVSVSGLRANILRGVLWDYGTFNGDTGAEINTTNDISTGAVDVSEYTGKIICYKSDAAAGKIGFWDASGAFISGIYADASIYGGTVPANAATMRLATSRNATAFSVYFFGMDEDLLDSGNEVSGQSYDASNGVLGAMSGFNSQKVQLPQSGTLVTYGVASGAFFGAADNYISGMAYSAVHGIRTVEVTAEMAAVGINYRAANAGVVWAQVLEAVEVSGTSIIVTT